MTIDLQLFSEKALDNQTANELRKGIRTFRKNIEKHWAKIENPTSFYPDWDLLPENKKKGDIRHWKKEIADFEESIQNRIDELKARGENYE